MMCLSSSSQSILETHESHTVYKELQDLGYFNIYIYDI